MQIYISADIEGTCGIADWSETERKTMDDYRPFQQQMTREVAAACAGAVAAGATPPAILTPPLCPERRASCGGGPGTRCP